MKTGFHQGGARRAMSVFGSGGRWLRVVWCDVTLLAAMAAGWPSASAQPAAVPASVQPSGRGVAVAQATDVVRQWQPRQHLYVKGNLGVSASALDGLEAWLEEHATNWVVVLADNADGESYTDAEGQTFRGVEAVNHALGKGLMNQTTFGQQLDPRTQERDAAFFILFLKERQLSYYGSDAQDRRGVGEDHWKGNLDQPAVSAMRNGARVVDAVKDTISNIDRRLSQRIVAEAEEAKRRAAAEVENAKRRAASEQLARQQAIEQAKASLENARADYLLVDSKAGDFARRYNGLTGDLVRPDLAGLKAELAAVQNAVAQNDSARAKKLADALHARTQALVRGIEKYSEDGRRLEDLSARLSKEKSRASAGAAGRSLQAAQEALTAARREYDRGDSSYVELLEGATRAVAVAGNAVEAAEALAARQRLLLGMALFSVLAGALAAGLILNRRRLPSKNEAHLLHDLWEKGLSEKTAALYGLLDRRSGIVGVSADEAAQRYSGETLQLCQQIIQDVDELLIMSSCAGRVLQQASGLIEPDVVWPKITNLFLAGRYRQAVALLRDQPIAFKPEEGLELVVRGARTDTDRLLGGLASYEPFKMSFNEVIDAFNQRAQRALSSLDLLESSLRSAPGDFEAIRKSIDQTSAAEAALAGATEKDGYFDLRRLFGELLPSARKALSSARQTAISNPVQALRAEGARAKQQAADGAAIVAGVEQAREQTLPLVRKTAEALAPSEIGTAWLDAALKQLSVQTDAAVKQSLESSAQAGITALKTALADLETRCRQATALDKVRREQSQPQIAQSTAAIKQAREDLGAGLSKPPGETLREQGSDPTDFVAQAQAQLEAGFAALSRGDLSAAQGAFEAVGKLTTQANEIVAASREAFGQHGQTLAALQAEARRVAELVPEHARILSAIQAGFAPSVLTLGAGDIAHPNANGTLADNIEETETLVAAARGLLDRAASVFAEAKVLEAAALLRDVRQRLETASHRLAEIEEKQQRLDQTDAANRQLLEQLEQRRQECERLVNDPTAMRPTIQSFEETVRLLESARAAALAERRDPFQAAEALGQVRLGLDAVADRARCDRDIFDQAGRSLAAAASQFAEAERIAERSATDNLPDSAAILRARDEVASLGGALQTVQQRHREAHGDWHNVDEEANGISNRAAAAAATLKGELEQAQASVAALSAAANAVRAAGAWTGGFGVLILGTPGSDILGQARGHLARGEYQLALRLAENARRAAERAIAQAQAEERRRREEEEARIELERRRRREEEARRSLSRASSGFGGGSSSWSSSGSGASSSSFRSGSGVSTSSW